MLIIITYSQNPNFPIHTPLHPSLTPDYTSSLAQFFNRPPPIPSPNEAIEGIPINVRICVPESQEIQVVES